MSIVSDYQTLVDNYAGFETDPERNFNFGVFYDSLGQNAGAASFYIRTAEFGYETHKDLAYEALLRLGLVIGRQSHRFFSARGSLTKAIGLAPERPEGYFLLSRFYEQAKEYEDSYFVACMGLAHAKFDGLSPLRTDVGFPGEYGLLFEKAVSGWWIGYKDEASSILLKLNKMKLDPIHRQAVTNNMKTLGLEEFITTIDFSSQVPRGDLCFDIGANVGEATLQALQAGYGRVVALEPAPRVYESLKNNFQYDHRVVTLKLAVSDKAGEEVEFYECVEDGLSTLDKDWLTGENARYRGKQYQTINVKTTTINKLAKLYGVPDLVKIDVEGAEALVIKGMSCKPKNLAFEWHVEHLDQCFKMLKRLCKKNGYTEYALQYITHHMHAPKTYRQLEGLTLSDLLSWHEEMRWAWESSGWVEAGGLRPTADAGMIWVR